MRLPQCCINLANFLHLITEWYNKLVHFSIKPMFLKDFICIFSDNKLEHLSNKCECVEDLRVRLPQ